MLVKRAMRSDTGAAGSQAEGGEQLSQLIRIDPAAWGLRSREKVKGGSRPGSEPWCGPPGVGNEPPSWGPSLRWRSVGRGVPPSL
ncbi:hypothetical protein NDU88_010505 [Pleurodeles waltl]|uniref:Uncharacterized protein n=1 Tax=Pleurodeles waltl TaxID=8319 RepID=A0AAV7Q257_PLEWA|nr:hypothetical protein NDU88_010505 [Pleurodeles waltl]